MYPMHDITHLISCFESLASFVGNIITFHPSNCNSSNPWTSFDHVTRASLP